MAFPLLIAGVAAAAALIVILEINRQRSREAAARAAATAKVSVLLDEALGSDEALCDVLGAVVPLLADWAAIHLSEQGRVRRAAVLHRDKDRERAVSAYFETTPFDPAATHGPARVMRTGAPEQLDPALKEIIDAQPEPTRRLVASLGMDSMIVVPLRARQQTVGALTLVRGPGRRKFGRIDLDHAHDIGHRIGLAVENARLYNDARQLFEQTLTANFVSTPEGRLIACNDSFAQLLGFGSVEETLAQKVETFYPSPSDRVRVMQELRQRGRLAAYEGTLIRRDGGIVHIIETAVGSFDDRGELVKITGFIVDKTTQKELEEQLRQSQRLEAIGQLAGGIAHDFNNLLTVIIGCVDLLRVERGAAPPAGDHDALDEIAKAARRAAGLTQQLLAFSRRQILQPRNVDLNDALRNIHSMLRRVVRENIVIVLALDPSLRTLRVDPGQLDQVIVNLVVNASDAIAGAGTITLTTGNAVVDENNPPPHAYVAPGEYVRFHVRDTGVGMDESTRARVFEPFFTTKPLGKGTGLGLSTVYGIVKQSGGYVWIDSARGEGTSVTIYLPVAAAATTA